MPDLTRPASIGASAPASSAGTSVPRQSLGDRQTDDELDFGRYLEILLRHAMLLAAGALVGLIGGLAYSATRPVRYEAVTTLMAHAPIRPGPGGVERTALRGLIESQSLAREVITELGLDKPPHLLTAQRFSADAVQVDELVGPNLFRIRVRLSDPKLATEASRSLGQKAVALNKQVAIAGGALMRDELKPRMDAAAEKLKATEDQLLSYQRHAQVDMLQSDTDAALAARQEVSRLLVDIEAEKARLTALEAELQRRRPLLSAGRGPGARETSRPATSDATGAAGALALGDPGVNRVDARLELQIASSRATLAALERRRRELVSVRKLGASELRGVNKLYERQIELARVRDQYEMARRVFVDLAQRHDQASGELMASSAYLQVVDPAVQPDSPMPRRTFRTLAVALLMGLAAATVAAVILESFNALRRRALG